MTIPMYYGDDNFTVVPDGSVEIQSESISERISENKEHIEGTYYDPNYDPSSPITRNPLYQSDSDSSVTSPQNVIVGGLVIDEKQFGYRPNLGNFKLFVYQHKPAYFVN